MGVEIQAGGTWKEAADRTPIGVISAFGGTVAPDGWFICDGTTKSRTTYADLYAVIGTSFGAGEGVSTFNLPNLQGVALTGTGTQSINGRAKAGPALGAAREDQIQGHHHPIRKESTRDVNATFAQVGASSTVRYTFSSASSDLWAVDAVEDLVPNGTPRTGAYTHGPEVGVNFIIKH